jgi:hypothetical protein
VVLIADTLPSWADAHFLRTTAGVLAVVSIVLLLVAVFMIRSIGVRVLIVVLLGAAVAGLLRYRETLDHCDKSGCACKLFGANVRGGSCQSSSAPTSR